MAQDHSSVRRRRARRRVLICTRAVGVRVYPHAQTASCTQPAVMRFVRRCVPADIVRGSEGKRVKGGLDCGADAAGRVVAELALRRGS